MTTHTLRFPIGHFQKPDVITPQIVQNWITEIAAFPEQLIKEVTGLTDEQLNTPYRPDGWTIRQVVHHCADSHMNSLIRFKLALTEDTPTIKPYFEDRWAELVDSKTMPVEPALKTLEGIHARWVVLLNSLSEVDLSKTFIHPEHGNEISLRENTGVYAWHGKHHLAHITVLKQSKGW